MAGRVAAQEPTPPRGGSGNDCCGVEQPDLARLAISLSLAMTRLRSRLREEARFDNGNLSISQVALLGRLIAVGAATAADLATAEHVTQQAIAQTVSLLKAGGLVAGERDPSDGRKSLLSATPAGRGVYQTILDSHDVWLIRAIETTLSHDERALLAQATGLLERLGAAAI